MYTSSKNDEATKVAIYNIFSKVLNPLSNITRWSNKDCSENKSLRLYTELGKQGLNKDGKISMDSLKQNV